MIPKSKECATLDIANGTIESFDDSPYIYYDGYWIRYYKPPEESLSAKKKLIDALTKRTFHHTEAGINTPGDRLEMARKPTRNRLIARAIVSMRPCWPGRCSIEPPISLPPL